MRNKLKLISIASTVLVLSLSVAPVFAETGTSTSEVQSSSASDLLSQKQELVAQVRVERTKREKNRIKDLQNLAQNQINRAQKELDRFQLIIERIKVQRAKLTATSSSADLTKIDDMITKAVTLQTKIAAELADAKTKQVAIGATLPKVETSINSDTSTTISTNTTAPTLVIQSVKDFQASIKVLKKDLITLHGNLQQIVKLMKKQVQTMETESEIQSNSTSTTTNTNTEVNKENQ